ncbi:hypothetical protein [Nocardioides sp.]|uniref:hypothetical protein n=1 Tax=Nocardioides sp. TaxID=35761 RepID=UPI0039E705BC
MTRDLKVEVTDSLGMPVVVISDGVESVLVSPESLSGLVAQLRRAESALILDASGAWSTVR